MRSCGNQISTEYRINIKSDLNTFIIPHFDKYPLSSVKLHNYKIWYQMVVLLINKIHLTNDGLTKLKELQSTLNFI